MLRMQAMLGVTGINLIIFVIWVMIPGQFFVECSAPCPAKQNTHTKIENAGQDNKLLTFLVSVGNLMCMIIFRGSYPGVQMRICCIMSVFYHVSYTNVRLLCVATPPSLIPYTLSQVSPGSIFATKCG